MVSWATANGATIANTTTETILFPNITIPANFMQDGRVLRIVAMGKFSNIVTTPGNLNFLLRWGGVAGTIIAQGTPTALSATAQTDIMFRIELEVTVRGNGATGSLLGMGWAYLGDAVSGGKDQNFMGSAGSSVPAAVTVDLTADTALALTAQFSIANAGNSITGMQYFVEALN